MDGSQSRKEAVRMAKGDELPRTVTATIIEGMDYRPPAVRAKSRPANYLELEPREQWEIDKQLGILDWDGT
jgi:hypothetical protein